jgi:tetratricopeptide (TPR) repeat protein
VLSSLKKDFNNIWYGQWPFWLAAFIIIFLTFTAYYPALYGGFIWDDPLQFRNNPLMTTPGGLWRIWTTTESPQYYPLTQTTFWIERRLWGLQPMGYHLVNVALHSGNAILFWLLLRRLKIKGAWLAGAIFALHPVHVESVAWISERKNVLSGFFYLLALLSYLGHEDKETGKKRWYAFALLFFSLSLLSKTVTCTLPVSLIIIRWMRGKRINMDYVRNLIPFFLIGIVMGLVTVWWEVQEVGARGDEWSLGALDRLVLSGRVVWFYMIKLFLPVRLIFIYPRWEIDATALFQWVYIAGAAALALTFFLLRRRIGRRPAAGVFFFVVTLFPALGFFDVYPFQYSFVADHFQYLASMGVIALGVGSAAWGLERWYLNRAGVVLGVMVLLVLGILTWRQGYIYKNEETLWRDTINKNPGTWMAHTNLGIFYEKRERLDDAFKEFQITLRLRPEDEEAHYNIGLAYYRKGRLDEAIKEYKEAINLNSEYIEAYNNLGLAFLDLRMFDKAIKEFETALRLKPDYAGVHNNLGLSYAMKGQFDEAIEEFQITLRLNPYYGDAHNNLGAAYLDLGMFGEAIKEFKAALRLKPDNLKAKQNLEKALNLKRQKR